MDTKYTRKEAQFVVDKFNAHSEVGDNVFYLKSQLEGKVKLEVLSKAYVLGDNTPAIELKHIGTALLSKIERL